MDSERELELTLAAAARDRPTGEGREEDAPELDARGGDGVVDRPSAERSAGASAGDDPVPAETPADRHGVTAEALHPGAGDTATAMLPPPPPAAPGAPPFPSPDPLSESVPEPAPDPVPLSEPEPVFEPDQVPEDAPKLAFPPVVEVTDLDWDA